MSEKWNPRPGRAKKPKGSNAANETAPQSGVTRRASRRFRGRARRGTFPYGKIAFRRNRG